MPNFDDKPAMPIPDDPTLARLFGGFDELIENGIIDPADGPRAAQRLMDRAIARIGEDPSLSLAEAMAEQADLLDEALSAARM